jgi:hypothetical protein
MASGCPLSLSYVITDEITTTINTYRRLHHLYWWHKASLLTSHTNKIHLIKQLQTNEYKDSALSTMINVQEILDK